jgi:hypothetical protein
MLWLEQTLTHTQRIGASSRDAATRHDELLQNARMSGLGKLRRSARNCCERQQWAGNDMRHLIQ